MYLLLVDCLFERFVNTVCIYSRCLSIIILVHWCCSELIVHTNTGITVKCLLSDVWYFTFLQSLFSWGEITCGWVLNLCLIYPFLQQLTRSRTVYCITRCEKIIEHTGTPVNIIYYIVALLQYEYTSKEIIISLNRSYLMLLLLYCFLLIWIDRNYFLLQDWPKLAYLWSHERFIIWWIDTD